MKSPHEVSSKSRAWLGLTAGYPCHVAEVNHWESVDGAINILEMNLAKLAQDPRGPVVWLATPRCATVVNESHSLEVFFEVGIPQFMNGLFLC